MLTVGTDIVHYKYLNYFWIITSKSDETRANGFVETITGL